MAFVYPDRDDLSHHKILGEYPTLNECLEKANKEAGTRGAYECGLNCRDSGTGSGTFICDRTVGNEQR